MNLALHNDPISLLETYEIPAFRYKTYVWLNANKRGAELTFICWNSSSSSYILWVYTWTVAEFTASFSGTSVVTKSYFHLFIYFKSDLGFGIEGNVSFIS